MWALQQQERPREGASPGVDSDTMLLSSEQAV
jgi:hypothetical protein